MNGKNGYFASALLGISLTLSLGAGLLSGTSMVGDFTTKDAIQVEGSLIFSQPLPVSDIQFSDQYGQPRNLANLRGHWTLVFFGYTFCPDICPTTLADINRVWKQLPPDDAAHWQLVMVSVDPERDKPQNLNSYLKYFNSEFIGLTGNPSSLQVLASELNGYFAKVERENAPYLMDHSANMMILDEKWNYRGYIEPPFTADRLLPLLQQLPVLP